MSASVSKILGMMATFMVIMACTSNTKDSVLPAEGSAEWFTWVEQNVKTVTPAGHGPDVGEAEWCNAIEYKLFYGKSGLQPCSAQWNSKVTELLKN